MKTKIRPFVSLFFVVGMIGVVAPAIVSVYAASPLGILKSCAYYSESGHCVSQYPNEWACYNIRNRLHEDYQVARCLAWLNYGSRG